MSTQTQFKTASLSTNLTNLPIFKHYKEGEIATKVDSFRKGEKNLFWFFKLAIFGAIGYLSWVYVLPPVFKAIGDLLAVAATGVMIVALVIAAPVILKGIRRLTRMFHKAIIRHDPFAQLEEEKGKLLANKESFRIAHGKINQLRHEMEVESVNAEKEAESGQLKILTLQGKAEKIDNEMKAMVAAKGVDAKSEDEYVLLAADLNKTLAEAHRTVSETNQAKDFVEKYGTRANIMKKLSQKLVMVGTQMEIKIADFEATIKILKKDYEFGKKANAATSAAKSVLGFSNGWELDYALDVVTSTISADIAMASGNLRDIETLTTNYNLNSDELFENLNKVADKIKTNVDVVPEAKKYNNPEYKLTQSDRVKSGGFGELF